MGRMLMFYFVFTLLNIGIYYFLYKKSEYVFKNKTKSKVFILIFLLVQSTPLTLYRLGIIETEKMIGHFWVYLAYSSMSFLSYIFVFFIIFDLGRFSWKIVKKNKNYKKENKNEEELERREFIKKIGARSIFGTALLGASTGAIKATQVPTVKKVRLKSKKLEKGNGVKKEITFVQISDLHVGPTIRDRLVEELSEKIKKLEPDILFLTGDMIDAYPDENMMRILGNLKKVKAPLGKFFVSGNHEYYWGMSKWRKAFEKLGFEDLDNKNKIIEFKGKRILLTGIKDRASHYFGQAKKEFKEIVLSSSEQNFDYKIFLNHRPELYDEASHYDYDLQLSGHTHGGQFFPWNLVVNIIYRYPKGLYNHKGMNIYVNPGTGYWGPPNRLGVPNEITFFTVSC